MDLRRVSASDLAKQADIKDSYMSLILSGDRSLSQSVRTRENLARTLGVPRDWIERGLPIPTQGPVRLLNGSRIYKERPARHDPANLVAAMPGQSKRDLAKRLKVDPSMLSRPLTDSNARKYSKALGLDFAEVWPS